MKHKRNDPMCDLRDSQGDKKCCLLLLLFALTFFIRNKNVTSEECKTKKPFEIILHVGRVTSLQSWVAKNHVTFKPLEMNVLFMTTLPTLNACNSSYIQCYFKRFCVLHSSEVTFLFLIKKSRQKATEIEIAFFNPLGNLEGRTLDHFFYASHIRHNFPYKLIPISIS